jgi:hypothetical protein
MEETWVSEKPEYGGGRPMAREPMVVVRMRAHGRAEGRVRGRRWRGILGVGYGDMAREKRRGWGRGKMGYRKYGRAKNVGRNVNVECVIEYANVECVNGMERTSGCDCVLRWKLEDASDRSEIQETITTSITPCNILLQVS